MVNTIMIFIWGALDSILIYKVLRTVVTYELNRRAKRNYAPKLYTSCERTASKLLPMP